MGGSPEKLGDLLLGIGFAQPLEAEREYYSTLPAGFSTGFAVGAATEVASQEGVGVALSMIGLTVGLGVITLLTALLRDWQIRRNP